MTETATTRRSPRRLWLSGIYVGYLLLLVLVLEGIARVLSIAPSPNPQPNPALKLYYEEPNGLVLLRPGASYEIGGAPVMINQDGFRDSHYSRRKSGAFRIAVLGDSFTQGDGVTLEETYAKQLEALWNERSDSAEVLNFGITATNTLNQLELLRAKVLDYQPDLVVLGFNINDFKIFEETSFERAQRLHGVEFEVLADDRVLVTPPPRTTIESVKNAIYQRSNLWRALYRIKQSLTKGGQQSHLTPAQKEIARFRQEPETLARHPTTQAILELNEILERRGIIFLCAILPAMTEFNTQEIQSFADYPYRDIHVMLSSELAERGVESLDLLPAFDGQTVKSVIVSRHDPHFNRAGNRVIAEALRERLNLIRTVRGSD